MPILQRTLSFENDAILNHLSSVEIEVEFPRFSFRYTGNGIQRFVSGVEKYSTIHNLKDKEYSLHLPLTRMVGLDLKDICGFFLYHFIEIMNPDRNINEFSIPFVVHIKDMSGQRITSMEFEGLLYEEKSVSIDYDENRYERELSKFESVYGSKEIEDLNVAGLQHLASAKDKSVFIINKSSFESLPQLLNGADQTVVSSHIVLELVEIFHSMTKINPILKGGGDVLLYELQSFSERTQVTFDQSFTGNLETLTSELFDFPLELPIVQSVIIKGVFELVSESNIKISDLDFYDLSIEYPQFSGLPKIVEYNWSVLDNMPTSNSVEFAFSDENTIVTNQVNGLITVRVKGYDGAVLWEENFLPTDDRLSNITIKIKKYPENDIVVDNSTGKPKSIKRLRGKVLQNKDKHDLNELTIIVRALKAEEEEYQIVSAGKTDKSGNFSMDYPYGKFTGAHALVSLMPNSPANIKINLNGKNESISDDFIYLLLTDEVIAEAENTEHSEEDCDCHTPQKAKRLPDQIDLIESDEYTQDIGGACLNLSTPNRTLNEYSYNAIVRISDPDVSNYVLNKVIESDGKVNYKLIGEGKTLSRKEVNLNNPIRWQDAPEANSDLSLYQAVTIATGHILYFKSVYKADGYSLGDLVYSLPLAPGQKKQIVVFESSHSLMGAESQAVSQGESLSAGLVSDRFITDEISGSLGENLSGRSKAHTSGMSMGLGASGSYGGIGASLGIAGGFSNSNSSATQNSSRNISQFFGEKLRQSLLQNAESYRQLNASVVTTVTEGQEYGVTSEVIANHNHCHSMTMMYFEVLRHYAIFQEVSHVEECVFVPLLMTHFSTENIHKWKDVLASNLLPIPSNMHLQPFSNILTSNRHPLLGAFDANERIKTNYSRVDFPPEGSNFADGNIIKIDGEFTLRVDLRRPKSKYDRIKSLPIITQTVTTQEVDPYATAKKGFGDSALGFLTGGLSLLATGAPGTDVQYKTTQEEILVKAQIFDQFMILDANYQSVPPAKCIRIKTFKPRPINVVMFGFAISGAYSGNEFFEDGIIDKQQWTTYANILGYNDVYDFLEYYFAGRLIAEWDEIFAQDILPEVYSRIIDDIRIDELSWDLTSVGRYTGGHRRMRIRFRGESSKKRVDLPSKLDIKCDSEIINSLQGGGTILIIENVKISYSTPFFKGTLFRGHVGDDLLDGTTLDIPLTSRDKINPRKEDQYIVNELIEHLNSNLEYYNKLLWTNLDPDRRYMLLDGFSIQTYTASGHKAKMRSLASVVKNELITITGNSLVFPVSDGYRVGRDSILEEIGDDVVQEVSLIELYKPLTPVPPYRVSVPTRGVFMEAIMGQCDACEMVKENSSQDWDKFKTEEPTSIQPIVTPTPTITEYKPNYKDFAQPLVNIQNAPDAPAPGVGLTQLNELLGKADAFNNITGLAKNQDNAIETFKANTAAAQKYAEMASSLAKQQHNTQNSEGITDRINKAKKDGYISDEDAKDLTRQHLQQQIDGGEKEKIAAQFEQKKNKTSLAKTASEAVSRGQNVDAQRTDADGSNESISVKSPEGSKLVEESYLIEGMTQPPMGCWATVATMLINWKTKSSSTVIDVLLDAGNNLDPANENFYVEMFNSQTGLASEEKNRFIEALGMEAMPPANYPPEQYYDWLVNYGPLWVTIDGNSSGGFSPHALLLFGIQGDLNKPNEVLFKFINPENGQRESKPFNEFENLFEQMVVDNTGDLFLQVVRFSDQLLQQSEGGSNSDSNYWNIPAATIVDYATQVANDEFDTWWTGGLLDNNRKGRTKVTEYWLSLRSVSSAASTAAKTGRNQVAWSAAFISYLLLRAYLHAVVNYFPATANYSGLSLENYDSLSDANKRKLLIHAKKCLARLGVFHVYGNHVKYIGLSMLLSGNTINLLDPSTEAIQPGDLVLNGREGQSYAVDSLGKISPKSGKSHVDIVVGIVDVEGNKFARLVGGNTTKKSDRVAYKLRPLDGLGRLVQEADLNNISLDIINERVRTSLTAIPPNPTSYYSLTGFSSLVDGAGDYETVLIGKTEIIARYS